ncbi:TetR/AcrR family transcriptional regulator [Microbacteriaceae bacterium VKM Ac-2855]|nr:TetR/AcrR family transcriptional regulator [Microbacteriaceae bacterium VKM Ac-2855]
MHEIAASAPTKRAKRIPAEEVRVRMIAAARDVVARDGLTVSFDHLPMEEYIKKAGVPRSSVYRIWSTREEFVADLIGEVFSAERYSDGFDPTAIVAMTHVYQDNLERMDTAVGRRAVVHEMIRVGTTINFHHLSESVEWVSYNTLFTSLDSIPDGPAHAAVSAVVERIETRFAQRMAAFYRDMIRRYGVTLKPGCTPDQIAALTAMIVEGVASRIRNSTSALDAYVEAPGLDGEQVEWHLAAYTIRSVIDGMIDDFGVDGPIVLEEDHDTDSADDPADGTGLTPA